MHPKLITDPTLYFHLNQIKLLEPLIYAANEGANRTYFQKLLSPNFWEIAASGKRYCRDYVLDELEKRQQNPFPQTWHTTDHYLQRIAEQLYLYSYTLHQPTRISQRTSLWLQSEDGWQLVYHQGTVV